MEENVLIDIRCKCGKLLGKIDGKYELKCQRCKVIQDGVTPKIVPPKRYDTIKGE